MKGKGTRRSIWLLLPVVAFLLFVSTQRAPITVIPPLLERIGDDLGISTVSLGLLTSIPALCFGLLTPAASAWIRRMGINTSGQYVLALLVAGGLVRSSGSVIGLFAGTVMIGTGLTLGNLLVPMIIGRDFRRRAPIFTGIYTSTVNLLVTASTALAVPLAMLVGWRMSAAAWAIVPALCAWGLWIWAFPRGLTTIRPSIAARAGREVGDPRAIRLDTPGTTTQMLRWPFAWLLAISFGCQAFSYFAVTAWLPTALADLGRMSDSAAGVAASVFQLTGVVGPLLVPVMLVALRWPHSRVMAVVCACWIVLPFGLVLVPAWWLAWAAIAGFAQGAFFAALTTMMIQRTRTVDENRQLTALVQTVAYCAAAIGPVAIGWVHQLSDGWTVPFLVIGLATILMTVGSQIATRDTSLPPTTKGIR